MEIKEKMQEWLRRAKTDQEIIRLFELVRAIQTTGVQLKEAIERALKLSEEEENEIKIQEKKKRHKDNQAKLLAMKHADKLIKLKEMGYGYGRIAKLLAMRSVYNKKTRKAYSRSTIKRALKILEEEFINVGETK